MFKSLIATCLLTFSCSSQPQNKQPLKRGIETQQAVVDNSVFVHGNYNFCESFESLNDVLDPNVNFQPFEVRFADVSNQKNLLSCPTNFDYDNHQWYIEYISFNFVRSNNEWVINGRVYLYNNVLSTYNFYYSFTKDSDLSSVTRRDFIFTYCDSLYLYDSQKTAFNYIFTHDDNSYVTTYNGYYNFNANLSSFNSRFYVGGTVTFDFAIGYDLTNFSHESYQNGDTFEILKFDNIDNVYYTTSYTVPLTLNVDVTNSNLYLNGCKISNSHKLYLETIGIFAYVRDTTYDDADFHDLLFSVMDSPVYFLSRLMSFELFGINLFVAFTGLLTFCVILILIRKFW